ncbi:hypothetical protein EYW49_03905 [Siculibacillus lacustris]|uniref:HypC/HybG/HupF family hydrogenase formation chaperone n=1 Tax=Siculibacillus lacustris TaxID=1549641 RepID=A0A4Q9VVN8_9HYPH|nr:HypC/HybG/HupF family hydrogenase formation chaperone [Siculibacillus lacustris]TBW40336.1 hypothetical protein EYW49_03905 [Siculibacillus lacustris]
MCIALPMRIAEVVDPVARLVAVVDGRDGSGREVVSTTLAVAITRPLDELIGGWALVHAGFLLELIDAVEARSRLQMFAAMAGDGADLDLAAMRAERDAEGPAADRGTH